MSDDSGILAVERVEASLSAANKKALFQQLGLAAGRRLQIPARTIAARLAAREKIGSTGFGDGVAIPHAKIEGLEQVVGFFARLTAPIDFQSVDGLPVDLVFLILSPPDAGVDHLKALAAASRALRDQSLVDKLRGARSRDAIYALLSGIESVHAA
jgi:PTS system nitrogen regulatory IIA component